MTKPRNVRNFWLELTVDGKATGIATGPKASNGGFYLTIKQRSNGEVAKALVVHGYFGNEGDLHLIVRLGEDTTDNPARDSGRFLCEVIGNESAAYESQRLHIVSPR